MEPKKTTEVIEESVYAPILSSDIKMPIRALLRQTFEILLPTDISGILWMSSQTVTMMFVGHYLGEDGMSSYSAGVLIFNVMAMSVVSGLGSAIDTISSQAFGRDPRSPVIGETLQRALIVDFILWVIMSLAFIYSTPIMVYIFGDTVGTGAANFLSNCPLYLMMQIISGTVSKTLFSQRQSGLVACANGAAALTSPIANYFLTPIGIEGAALSLGCTVGLCATTHVLFCIFHPAVMVREAQWPSPALLQKEGWITFMKVGIPSLIAVCAEWWAFEVQAFFAVSISSLALAVFGVTMNIVALMFSLALGLSVSASVVIGNALGAQKPIFAAQYSRFIIIVDLILGACTAILMGIFGGHIARLYTNVPEVAEAVESTMPLVIICHVGDSLQFCLQGVFRGAGRPEQAAHGVVLTLWLIGMPASALYVYVFKWGVKGVIGGLITGFIFEIPLLYFMMSRWDWQKLVQDAQTTIITQEVVILENLSASSEDYKGEIISSHDIIKKGESEMSTFDVPVKFTETLNDERQA